MFLKRLKLKSDYLKSPLKHLMLILDYKIKYHDIF